MHQVFCNRKNAEGKYQARDITKEGPTGFIITSTDTKFNQENKNRCIEINPNDSKEQTQKIMDLMADMSVDGDKFEQKQYSEWIEFQKWLSLNIKNVKIPYMRAVAALCDPRAVRLRRDFKKVILLIKTHALIHQNNRDYDSADKIIAEIEDYAAIYKLINRFLSYGIESSVPKRVRETVKAIKNSDSNEISVTELSKMLDIDKSTASRRAAEAARLGYLKNNEPNPGRPAKYCFGEPLIDNEDALPEPQAVLRHLKEASE